MDRRYIDTAILAAAAFFTLTVAVAQSADPTVPENADDEQTMVPENANDDRVLTPDDGDESVQQTAQPAPSAESEPSPTPGESSAPTVTETPAAEPIRQAAAPPPTSTASPMNVLILAGNTPAGDSDPLRGGCWVRLHEAPNFSGNTLTIVGPADMPELQGPFGMEWEDNIGSLEVGPSGTVTIFSDDGFDGTQTLFGAGRRVADVPEELESLRIACRGTGRG
jgi:hypothetical protein